MEWAAILETPLTQHLPGCQWPPERSTRLEVRRTTDPIEVARQRQALGA